MKLWFVEGGQLPSHVEYSAVIAAKDETDATRLAVHATWNGVPNMRVEDIGDAHNSIDTEGIILQCWVD